MLRSENRSACRACAADSQSATNRPRRARSAAIARARSAGSFGCATSPSDPSRMASGTPSTRVATTGTPAAIASRMTIGSPSPNRLGSTNRSIRANSAGTSRREADPVDRMGQCRVVRPRADRSCSVLGRFEVADGPQPDRRDLASATAPAIPAALPIPCAGETEPRFPASRLFAAAADRPADRGSARRWARRGSATRECPDGSRTRPGCARRRPPRPRSFRLSRSIQAFSRSCQPRVESRGGRTVHVMHQRHAGQGRGQRGQSTPLAACACEPANNR